MRYIIPLTMLLLGWGSACFALPPIPNYLKEALADNADAKAFNQTVEALKSKCDICHKSGVDKKVKGHGLNDFGQAFHRHLDDKSFMTAHKEKKTTDALKLITEAWAKTAEAKNAEGATFGSLIKAGKLPGKNE